MKKIQCMFLGLVVLVAASQTGCNLAPKTVGEEKSSMLKGTQTVLQTDPVTITAAAKAVADEMQLSVEKNVSSGLDGKLIAKSANRMKLVVVSKAYGPGSTLVTIRAGGFGDRGVQKQVLERIKLKLPATAYTPPPQPVKTAKNTKASGPQAPNRPQQPAAPGHATTDGAQLPF
jgi:uncharacterized protein DUF3568